jgi:type I restriction enzyme S subunit
MRELFASTVKPLYAQQDNLDVQNERLAHARDLLFPRLMSGELAV